MRSDEVVIDAGDVRLGATVWAPDGRSGTPGTVLIGGSGPTGRTNGGYFDAIRDRLVDAGVTVLGFDKRGVGDSTGAWAPAGVDVLAADAGAAVEALRARPGVDPGAVALFGHSEGGWVALRACADGALPCRLVLNSCPAVSFLDAEVHALTVAGVPADRARAAFERLREAAHAGAGLAAAAQVIAGEREPALHVALDTAGFRLGEETWAQFGAWIDYAPEADLARLRIPTVAMYGAQDPLTPVRASVDRLGRLAPGVQVRVFACADHRLRIGDRFAQGYLDVLTAWCASTAAGAGDAAR